MAKKSELMGFVKDLLSPEHSDTSIALKWDGNQKLYNELLNHKQQLASLFKIEVDGPMIELDAEGMILLVMWENPNGDFSIKMHSSGNMEPNELG
jgi:hypothetical protein